MKDVAVTETAVEDTTEEVKVLAKEAVTMTEEKDSESQVKKEVEDSTDKILNNLTAGVQNLNIKPEEDEEEYECNVQGDEDDEKNKSDDSEFAERGPNGGRPVEHTMAPVNMMPKNMPLPVMLSDGRYFHCQQQQQIPYSSNGNRRSYDESEDYGQPQKYCKPQEPHFTDQNMLMQPPMSGFQFGDYQMNNLSGMPKFSQQQPFFEDHTNDFFQNINFSTVGTTTTTMKSVKSTSGGQVTVTTPPCGTSNYFDDLIDQCEIPDTTFPDQQIFGNMPNFGSTSPNSQIEFSGQNYTEYRRQSQDTDSGLDSDSAASPLSDQAPSPGNVYPSPASVDSGCGRSPLHESQNLPGMSPPKYAGAPSPMSHRATPSPAATSGYGSPGQPQFEDSNEFFSQDKQEELEMLLQVMENVVNQNKDKKQVTLPTSIPQQPVVSNSNRIPQPVQQQCQQASVAQTRPNTQQMLSQQAFPASTAVTSAPQIIILQPPSQPQLLVVPLSNTTTQQPKRTAPRKILPKMPQSSGSNSAISGISTSANGMSRPGVVSASQTQVLQNRNLNNQDKEQQNKLVMFARRSVANISREELCKPDDEGDTYLHIAVCKTDRYMVQALLERLKREGLHHLVDQENNKRQTPLYLAAFINQPVMVYMFIKFQANVNVLAQNRSSDGMTTEVKAAIHVAASHGKEYLRTLSELLKAKDISINIVNNYGQTALHCAILAHGKAKRDSTERVDSTAIIQTLIRAGADPSAQDKKSGKTPLMYAIEQKNHELVETILRCVDPDKVKNVVKTQAFDGSSCLKIAEGLKNNFDNAIYNKLWNDLHSAANGSMPRCQFF